MKNEKQIRVSFCPKCKSRKISHVFKLANLFGVIPQMRCGDCGFIAPTFPILVLNKAELEKGIKKLKKRNKKANKK